MDGFAKLPIPLLIVAGMNEAALAQAPYAAGEQYAPAYVYAPQPGWGFGPGAVIGAGMGALAGGSMGSLVGGSVIGAALGAVATSPPFYPGPVAYPALPATYAPAPSPPAYAAPVPRGSADTFISNWQSFMQPSTRR